MSDRPCPNCHARVQRWLEAPSANAAVDYYRCEACGHVWTVSKDGNDTVTHITPLPEEPD